jgi:secondary thiamine-phosphate synthase enzyme
MVYTIHIETKHRTEFIDITSDIKNTVQRSGIKSGLCCIFVPHTTAAVTINENADPNVISDIMNETNKIVPFKDNYDHVEGNSAAHIKSSLYGAS